MALLKLKYNGRTLLTGTGMTPRFFMDVEPSRPYLRFEFSVPGFDPRTANLTNYITDYEWVQVSTSPNQWDFVIYDCYYIPSQSQAGYGLPFLFGSDDGGNLNHARLGGGTCKIVRTGRFDFINDLYSFDRMFANCTGLTSIVPIQNPYIEHVGGMFQGCVNMETGALDQYDWFNTYGTNINNHSSTFYNCGSNTVSGLAELDQIPVGWGGNLVPASILMTSTATTDWGSKTTWKITGNAPDWTNIIGMYLFTEASVSTYAGVSMNRGRIAVRNGLGTTNSYALYFYPAFAQYTGSSASNRVINWVVTTTSPNGSLAKQQGNTDMPGTLDNSTYGTFAHEFGTYDSGADVYFLFFVTNRPIDEDSLTPWGGLSDAYGVLYNSNFKSDAGLRYYF